MTESNDTENPAAKSTDAGVEKKLPQKAEPAEKTESAGADQGENAQIDAADESAKKKDAQIESVEKKDPGVDEKPKVQGAHEKPEKEMQAAEDFDLNLLLDIPLEIRVELGRAKIQIQELLRLGPGSTVSLTKLEGEPVDILANDKLIARGEVVLQNKKYGIRITEITSRMRRIKSLS
jgi:flagellar motor switch protein FliN/FliY